MTKEVSTLNYKSDPNYLDDTIQRKLIIGSCPNGDVAIERRQLILAHSRRFEAPNA